MNHLDVAKIVQALDTYFLLFDSESATSVKAKENSSASIDGLIICRQLRNGRVEVTIDSAYTDNESIAVYYYKKGSKSSHDGYESLSLGNFSSESITNAIRKMVTLDCEVRKPKLGDAVLSPNN